MSTSTPQAPFRIVHDPAAPQPPAAAYPTRPPAGKARATIPLIERMFVVAAVLIYMSAFLWMLRSSSPAGGAESDSFTSTAQLLTVAILVLFAFGRRRQLWPLWRSSTLFILFFALCLASTWWSLAPEMTPRRALLMGSCFLFGFYAYAVFGAQFIRFFARITFAIAAISLLLYFVLPEIGRDPEFADLPLRGVFVQKNILAYNLLAGLACYLYLLRFRLVDIRESIAAIVLIALCVVMSNSATGIALTFMLIAFSAAIYLISKGGIRAIIAYFTLLGIVALLVLLLADPEALFELLGRDPTLTGRAPIWKLVWATIQQRPWLGYGFEGFWKSSSPVTQYLQSNAMWDAQHSHNGFLDVTLHLGLAGFLLTVWILVRNLRLAFGAALRNSYPPAYWAILFLLLVCAHNLVETTIMRMGTMSLLLAYCAALLGQQALANRPRRGSPAATHLAHRAPRLHPSARRF